MKPITQRGEYQSRTLLDYEAGVISCAKHKTRADFDMFMTEVEGQGNPITPRIIAVWLMRHYVNDTTVSTTNSRYVRHTVECLQWRPVRGQLFPPVRAEGLPL